jgi:hypothetical protein
MKLELTTDSVTTKVKADLVVKSLEVLSYSTVFLGTCKEFLTCK